MRGFLITILILFTAEITEAQRFRYRDLYPMIQNESSEEKKVMLLKEYVAYDTEHPNANFLLSQLYIRRYREADILTDYERAIANAEQARGRLLKSQVLINERELRRNGEYYLREDGTEYEFEELLGMLREQYEEASQFTEQMPPVYRAFTRAVRHYDRAVKLYSGMAGNFSSIDDLYMFYDYELEDRLSRLSEAYDSTVFFLERFKGLTDTLETGYSPEYSVEALATFKLQGLVSRIPFLNDSFTIWNYKAWANEVISTANGEIPDIRRDLTAEDRRLQRLIDRPDQELEGERMSSLVDRELVYNIEKYDVGSLPVGLLYFKDHLYRWKLREADEVYYDTAADLETESMYIFYSQLLQLTEERDSLLQMLRSRMTDEKIAKHAGYIDELYGGREGLEEYVDTQELKRERDRERVVANLRSAILRERGKQRSDSGVFVTYKRQKYPAYVTGIPDSLNAGELWVTNRAEGADGSVYFSGARLDNSAAANLIGFIYKYQDGKVAWMKEFNQSMGTPEGPADNLPGALQVTRDGVALVLHLRSHSSDSLGNIFTYLGEGGQEQVSVPLAIPALPRSMRYGEAQNRFIVTFRSKNTAGQAVTYVVAINELGDFLWEQQLTYAGDFVDLLPLGDGYLLLANALAYEGDVVTGGASAPLLIRMNGSGERVSARLLKEEAGARMTFVIKASDSCINLMNGEDTHIIVDGMLNVLSSGVN